MATKARIWPDSPTHPGEVLRDELMARDLLPDDFAVALDDLGPQVTSVLEGRAPITADLAWALESAVEGISARFWMGLQADYDLGMARLRQRAG